MKIFNGLTTDVVVNRHSRNDVRKDFDAPFLYENGVVLGSNEQLEFKDIKEEDVFYFASENPTRRYRLDVMSMQSYSDFNKDSKVALGARIYDTIHFSDKEKTETFAADYVYGLSYTAPTWIYITYTLIIVLLMTFAILVGVYGLYEGWYFANHLYYG